MKTTTWMVAVIAGATVALVAPVTHAAAPTTAENAAAQPAFATPQEGAKALVDAARTGNSANIAKLMGKNPGWLSSGDKVADAAERQRFQERREKPPIF